MVSNKIANKITKVSRTLPQNKRDSSETVKSETENIGTDREIPNIYIYIYIYIYIPKKDRKLLMI